MSILVSGGITSATLFIGGLLIATLGDALGMGDMEDVGKGLILLGVIIGMVSLIGWTWVIFL